MSVGSLAQLVGFSDFMVGYSNANVNDNRGVVMSERDEYPAGVPCWVDTLQPDVRTALDFYSAVFGWEFAGPGSMPFGGEYHLARVRGRDAAGIGSTVATSPDAAAV